MNHPHPTRTLLVCALVSAALPLHAQTLDWGTWDNLGNATYADGGTISISGLSNGTPLADYDEYDLEHSIAEPLPFATNSPGNHQFGFFRNETETSGDWSILIDLSDFTFTADTVIGFSNLDGLSYQSHVPASATIEFRDSSGAPVSISSASFLGNYDTTFGEYLWDADSNFDLNTGTWTVTPNSGSSDITYLRNVGDAFFLTNLPETVASIVYTKHGSTDYLYDSTLFYAATQVPEPASLLLLSLGALGLLRRRR